jgi:hypothetical protein
MKTFDDFWPIYLQAHAHPKNRRFHFYGTGLVHIILFYVFVTGHLKYLILAPVVGYSFAWIGHFFIEKNIPLTIKHPIWSALADFRLFYLTLFKKN